MRTTLTAFIVLIWISAIAQFGTYSDQPFLKTAVASANPYDPMTIGTMAYYWKASDISSNTPVAWWQDRLAGALLVQTNSVYQLTNTTYGLCFDGHGGMAFSNSIYLPKDGSVLFIFNFAKMTHGQALCLDSNSQNGLIINYTNGPTLTYGAAGYANSGALNETNLNTISLTLKAFGANSGFATYTNGILNMTNYTGPLGSWPMDSIGCHSRDGIGGIGGRTDLTFWGYLKEIMIWTNYVLTPANQTYLNNYAVAEYPSQPQPFWTPAYIPTMMSWLRADGPTLQTAGFLRTNLSRVAYWGNTLNYNDQNNGHYSTPNAASAQGPMWIVNAGPNGKPAINLGDTTESSGAKYLAPATVLTNSGAQPNTYFFVIQHTNTATAQDLIDTTYGGNRQQHMFKANQTGFEFYAGTVQAITDPTTVTNWTLLTVVYDGANSYLRTNGVLVAKVVGSVGTFANPVPTLGDYGLGGSAWKGFISDAIMFNSHLSTNNLQLVEQYYMTNKYPGALH